MIYEPEDDNTEEAVEYEEPQMPWREQARKMAEETIRAKRDRDAEDSREQILARYILRLL